MEIQRDKCFWNAGCERPELMSTALARECNLSLKTKKSLTRPTDRYLQRWTLIGLNPVRHCEIQLRGCGWAIFQVLDQRA